MVYPVFWLVGASPVWGVLIIAWSCWWFRLHRYVVPFVCFFIWQLLSVLASFDGDWFQLERLAPILHNLIVYWLFVIGVSVGVSYNSVATIARLLSQALIGMFILSLGILYSYFFGGGAAEGVILKGLFGPVTYYRAGYFFSGSFPRITLLGSYPNSVAILVYLMFSICVVGYFSRAYVCSRRYFACLYLISFFLVVMAGSRVVGACVAIMPVLFFINKPILRLCFVFLAPIFFLMLLYYDVFSLIGSMREGSTQTRFVIYQESLRIWYEKSIILGLGIKPKLPDVIYYPIGSHSSFIGYLVKNGVIGFLFCVVFIVYVVCRIARAFISPKNNFVCGFWGVIFLSLILWSVEDLDSFEPCALLFGLLLGFVFKITSGRHEFFKVIEA